MHETHAPRPAAGWGWQRLWRLPASVEAQVRAQLGVTV